MMEDYAEDRTRRSGLPEPQRSEARMELYSHVFEAAREEAETDQADEIEVSHVREALASMAPGDDVDAAFFAERRAQMQRAPFGRRAVAYVVDFVILMIAISVVLGPILVLGMAPFSVFSGAAPVDCDPTPLGIDCDADHGSSWMWAPWVAFWTVGHSAIVVLAFAAFEVTLGQTPGKMIMDLRATAADGGPLDWTKGILRNVTKAFPFLLLVDAVVGYLVDDEARERVSDRLVGTIVVEEAG